MKKVELVFDRLSVDWTPEEDEAFNDLETKLWPFPSTPLPNKPGEPKKAQEIELRRICGDAPW